MTSEQTTRRSRMIEHFTDAFGREPEGSWAAPGRVNLIGEHTDYNDGFVLPLAIPQEVVAVAARNQAGLVRARSAQVDEPHEVGLDGLTPGAGDGWAAYVFGVVWALREAGHDVGGLDVLVSGDVPLGAGLSSSAALECATATALVDLYGLDIELPTLARLAQKAENDFVGMPCGVMDQSASLMCAADNALFIDCRTLDTEQIPLDLVDAGLSLLVVDTKAPHRHVDGEYAERRKSCERAADLLGVRALRDVESLDDAIAQLELADPGDPIVRKRVRHIVTENERVLETVRRLRTGSPREIGRLLTESHASMRDDYEITVPEVDTAVDAALEAGALGARMTGGGFGGCVIALVESDSTDEVAAQIAEAFAAKGFNAPAPFVTQASSGARRLA